MILPSNKRCRRTCFGRLQSEKLYPVFSYPLLSIMLKKTKHWNIIFVFILSENDMTDF